MLLKPILLFAFLLSMSLSFSQHTAPDTCVLRIEKTSSPKKRAKLYNGAADLAWQSGRYRDAIIYANRGISICKEHGYKDIESYLLNNKGIAYEYLNQYPNALKCYFAALDIQEKLDDPVMKANVLGNIGLVYMYQERTLKSIKYHKEALKIRKAENDLHGISASLNNLAILYTRQKKFTQAIEYLLECIRIDKELKDEDGLGDDYNNIGIAYMDLKQYEKAEEYLDMALKIRLERENVRGIAETYTNFGTIRFYNKDNVEARRYFQMAIPLAQQIRDKESLRYCYKMLYWNAQAMSDTIDAYTYFKLYIRYRDSIDNSEMARKQTELELNYAFDKEKEVDRLEQKEKDRQQKIILYSVSGGLVLIFGFSLLLLRKWKQTQRQRGEIEEKNLLVQRKNDEIMGSITYAKRIQNAILPSEETLQSTFPNHFVLYLPKDIVSGDFYWLDHSQNHVFFAVADCTGHGVPGALMSVICHNALIRAVHEFGLTSPAEILNRTRTLVEKELSKSEQTIADGMDVSLCCFDEGTLNLKWAGANNPLWIYRNASNEIEELKGDKQPIGHHWDNKPFTEYEIQLAPEDRIFLFSDGYADQFGGDRGKKMMSKRLKSILLENSTKSLDLQKKALGDAFNGWKGELEQIDDVCVVGIQLKSHV